MIKLPVQRLSYSHAQELCDSIEALRRGDVVTPQLMTIYQGLQCYYLQSTCQGKHQKELKTYYVKQLLASQWALEPYLTALGYDVPFDWFKKEIEQDTSVSWQKLGENIPRI